MTWPRGHRRALAHFAPTCPVGSGAFCAIQVRVTRRQGMGVCGGRAPAPPTRTSRPNAFPGGVGAFCAILTSEGWRILRHAPAVGKVHTSYRSCGRREIRRTFGGGETGPMSGKAGLMWKHHYVPKTGEGRRVVGAAPAAGRSARGRACSPAGSVARAVNGTAGCLPACP